MTPIAQELHPDTIRFLELFPGSHVFQSFDDSKPKRDFMSRISDNLMELAKINENGAGIHLQINESRSLSRKAKDVINIRAFFVDFDHAPLPAFWVLEPSLIVESSAGRWHAYWILKNPIYKISRRDWNDIQESIANSCGAQPDDCKGLNRVMRLPGYLHQKNPNSPFRTRIELCNGLTYEFSTIRESFMKKPRENFKESYDIDGMLKILTSSKEGERNNTLNKIAFKMAKVVENGKMLLEVAHENLLRSAIQVGLPEEEARRTIKSAFDAVVKNGGVKPQEKEEKLPLTARIMHYVREENCEFWQSCTGQPHMSVTRDNGVLHATIPSSVCREYLTHLVYRREGQAVSNQALNSIQTLMAAIARQEGQIYPVGVRIQHWEGVTYLDLGTSDWKILVISAEGWRVIESSDSPVRFSRPAGALTPLPCPERGGNLVDLRRLVSLTDEGYLLLISWLLAALSGLSPYPILVIHGEQGSGKSTLSSVIKRLIDPGAAERRGQPRSAEDLMIAAVNGFLLNFDNLSFIPEWLSDDLCRLSTEGAMTKRVLYSDSAEAVLSATRPVVINGIPELAGRADLMSRAIQITTKSISQNARMTEEEFWQEFARLQPKIMGALCDALVVGLRRRKEITLPGLPRMADFARLVVAAEPTLPWKAGEFLRVYNAMQTDLVTSLLDDSSVAVYLMPLMDSGEWSGTVKVLLRQIDGAVAGHRSPPDWPRTPKALGTALRRLSPALKAAGYIVEFKERTKEGQTVFLSKAD